MKKYEIIKNTIEITKDRKSEVQAGITLTGRDQEPEIIDSFDTLEEAKESLKHYRSDISEVTTCSKISYIAVEEFYIEESEYDEDGEWVSGYGISEFALWDTVYTIDIIDGDDVVAENVFESLFFSECVDELHKRGCENGAFQICAWRQSGDGENSCISIVKDI